MTKLEFLEELKEALEQDLGQQAVRENLEYYSQYIVSEIRAGKSESEVIGGLGDPWMIARTIIDTQTGQNGGEYVYEAPKNRYQREESSAGSTKVFAFDTWWKKLLLVLGIVGVVCVVFAIVTGIVNLIAPILIPVLIIMLLVRLLGGRR